MKEKTPNKLIEKGEGVQAAEQNQPHLRSCLSSLSQNYVPMFVSAGWLFCSYAQMFMKPHADSLTF